MDAIKLMFPEYLDNSQCKSLMIVGPKATCKTSLLFQIAVSLTTNSDDSVLLISTEKMEKVPLVVHRMPKITAKSAKNISLVYLKNYSELMKYLAELFVRKETYRGILIDGVEKFLQTVVESQDGSYKDCAMKLFALLVDTAGHFTIQEDTECYAAVTLDHKEDDVTEKVTLSSIGLHFFDEILQAEPHDVLNYKNRFRFFDSSERRIYYYVEDEQIFIDCVAELTD